MTVSRWFLLVTSFGALFLVTGKRYAELQAAKDGVMTRASLSEYSDRYLRFVIGLDSHSLSGVDRSETLLQFMQDVVVHGITSSKISAAFGRGTRLCRQLQNLTFGQRPGFAEQHG